MPGITVKKSSGFDNPLNFRKNSKQIEKNHFKATEVLKDRANQIAPIDTGKLRQSAKNEKSGDSRTLSWNTDYANKVYYKNNKNPQTTRWVEKAYEQKKNVLRKIMEENVSE